jgi:hypothetical protein
MLPFVYSSTGASELPRAIVLVSRCFSVAESEQQCLLGKEFVLLAHLCAVGWEQGRQFDASLNAVGSALNFPELGDQTLGPRVSNRVHWEKELKALRLLHGQIWNS